MDYEPIDKYRLDIKERLTRIETILHRELPDIKEQLRISNGRTRSLENWRNYILGGMAELGELSSQFHREVGEQLVLKGEDRVVLIGDESEQYKEGLLASGAQESQIMLKDSVEGARGILTFFRGAVFIKGSRSFQLERLVPESISDMDDRGEEAC